MTVWKWSGESRYPVAFPPVLENFRHAFSLGPTDRPWVSKDSVNGDYPCQSFFEFLLIFPGMAFLSLLLNVEVDFLPQWPSYAFFI